MEYKNKKMKRYEDQEEGYPAGYYRMGCNKPCKGKSKMDYHIMEDGSKMHGKKHYGPEGCWNIGC